VQIYWTNTFTGSDVFVELRAEDTGSLGLGAGAILGLIVFLRLGGRSGPVMLRRCLAFFSS